jgi:porin
MISGNWDQGTVITMSRHANVSVAVFTILLMIGRVVASSEICAPSGEAAAEADGCGYECCPDLVENLDAVPPCFDSCGLGNDVAPDSSWPGLTGDWHGVRPRMAESGLTFEGELTQFYMGVAHGGVREAFNYAGHGDYRLNADFEKLTGLTGLSLLIRAEHRFGEPLARDAGVIAPINLHAATPTTETEELILTNVLFTQVVNENLMVMFGKMDTLDGDRNPFASGRGKSQFMNTSLVEPVAGIPTVPFATLGAGAVFLVDGLPAAQLLVLNASNTITTSGFDELFAEGAAIIGGVNVPLPIAGKLGVHSFNAAWNSKTFTSLGQDPRVLGGNIPIDAHEGSWVVWWSGAQYLYQDPHDPMKGWGLFGRLGTAEARTSPIQHFMNFGIGGQSPLRGRKDDLFGVGWYYNRTSDELGPVATALLGIGNYSTGIELYYNYAVNDYIRVTPDLQVEEPALRQANTALILGVRCEVGF